MIIVSCGVSEDGRWELTMDGHAGHVERNEAGHDLVCCAASTLCYTLAKRIQRLVQDGNAHGPVMVFDKGHCQLAVSPREYSCCVEQAYETIMDGLELLRDKYPECLCTNFTDERTQI